MNDALDGHETRKAIPTAQHLLFCARRISEFVLGKTLQVDLLFPAEISAGGRTRNHFLAIEQGVPVASHDIIRRGGLLCNGKLCSLSSGNRVM